MLSKLRHPVRAVREPFGTAGLIVACVALIAALTGGAYAASGGLTAKQKKEVKKIAKKFAGKPGAPGAMGPAGPAGAKGATGAAGANGANGTNGANGLQGPTGEAGACSVEEPKCVLPPGATEVGRWSFIGRGQESFQTEVGGVTTSHTFGIEEALVSISFLLKVSPAIEFEPSQDFIAVGAPHTTDCPGSHDNPEAAPGHLCLYVQHLENAGAPNLNGYYNNTTSRTSGFTFGFQIPAGTQGFGDGTWAVTAPCPENELGEEEECVPAA